MTLGKADKQGDLLDDVTRFCDQTLDEHSIYSFLHRERDRLFPDEAFADLFDASGRRSVPPSVVAVVMVLQRLEGLSDREATERYCFLRHEVARCERARRKEGRRMMSTA
jgi:hypothetical protein